MRSLTLSQIDRILRIKEPVFTAKHGMACLKLVEVRAYLVGETKVEPKNPFLPLEQLPAEIL